MRPSSCKTVLSVWDQIAMKNRLRPVSQCHHSSSRLFLRTSSSRSGNRIAIGELLTHLCEWLSVHFNVRINEVVQRRPSLRRREHQIAANVELHAVCIMRAKEVCALRGILPRLRGVQRDPAKAVQIKLSPTVIAADLPTLLIRGQGKTNFEFRWNACGAGQPDEECVKVSAITALRFASP